MALAYSCCCCDRHLLYDNCYIRVHFASAPHFDLEPDYIIRKPIRHRIQRCNLLREILSTFHTLVDHRSVRHFPIQMNRAKMPKNARNHARNSPFPLRHVDFHLTHECLGPPTHHTKRQLDRCTHFHTTTQQSPHWLQWDAAKSLPNCPSLQRPLPKSNTPIPSPTPLTTPNGIRMQSAVLPLLTCAD